METTGLEGRFLISMPSIGDPRFHRTVIFICAHSEEGALGLIVNRPADGISFSGLLKQLDIETDPERTGPVTVRYGGPVETSRGFVLHTSDYEAPGSLAIDGGLCLSSTVDVLRDIANGTGPENAIIALGYAGWGAGQLEQELQNNGWLSAEADKDLVFASDDGAKWVQALSQLGISPELLAAEGGTA